MKGPHPHSFAVVVVVVGDRILGVAPDTSLLASLVVGIAGRFAVGVDLGTDLAGAFVTAGIVANFCRSLFGVNLVGETACLGIVDGATRAGSWIGYGYATA